MRWQGGKGGRVMRWQGRKGGGVVRVEGVGFLVWLKGGGCRVTSRFHLMVSDVNQGKERAGRNQDFLVWPQEWKDSP